MADEKARKDERALEAATRPPTDSTTPDEAVAPVKEPAKRQDETVPGGRYLVNGVLVDADGKPVKS